MSAPAPNAPAPTKPSAASPAPGSGSPPGKAKKIPWMIWIPFIVAAVIVIAIVAAVQLSSSSSTTTLESQGTSWQIPSGSYEVVSFSISKNAAISATVQSTNGIVVYAFTPTAYNDYKSAGMTTGSSWTSGPIVTGSFSVSLAAGSWYFVFVSPNPAFSTSVLFTGALVATAD